MVTGTSASPSPDFPLLRGIVPSALIPSGNVARTALSRTAPCSTGPAHPFSTAAPAMRSPVGAVRNEPPPSHTRNAPPYESTSSAVLTGAITGPPVEESRRCGYNL